METPSSNGNEIEQSSGNVSGAEDIVYEETEEKQETQEIKATEETIFPISLSNSPVEIGESEIVTILSDRHIFHVCPDCLSKKPAVGGMYDIALKTENDGTSYSLRVLFDFTGASSTQIDLSSSILKITQPAKKSKDSKERTSFGPQTLTETVDSKKYFYSRKLKKRTLNILYDASSCNKKAIDRISLYIDSLQIENIELVLNDSPWELFTMKILRGLLTKRLYKLVIIDMAFLQLNEFPEVPFRDQSERTMNKNMYQLYKFTTGIQTQFTKISHQKLSEIFYLLKLCFFLQSKKHENARYYVFKECHAKLIANTSPDFVKFVYDFYVEVNDIKMKTLQRIFDNFKLLTFDRILKDCIPEDYLPGGEFDFQEETSD